MAISRAQGNRFTNRLMIAEVPTREVLELFEQAVDLPHGDRTHFIERVAAARPDVAAELRELLGASERMGDFLADPAVIYAAPIVGDVELRDRSEALEFPPALRARLKGRYDIGDVIGEGGMAIVYRARDTAMGRDVAIKVLRPLVADALGGGRFSREIEITAALEHPRVVPVHDCGEADGTLYYIMKYCPGGTLRDRLKRDGQLPIDVAVSIARDVAAALEHAHDRLVIHRDVKPENILLDDNGAYLADFGIARLADALGHDRLTRTGIVVGTPAYMSPEQAGDAMVVDRRSDVYALACVLYEMLAGEPPYTGQSRNDILRKHAAAPIPRVSILRDTVTQAMAQVLDKALQKTPADRYASAGEFMDAFTQAWRNPDQGSTGSSQRQIGRRRIAAAAAVVVMLTAGTAMGVIQWNDRVAAIEQRSSAADADARRIAVLYFDDLSEDRRLGHIAAGLTEDLIDQLSQVSLLRVTSANGVRIFRDTVVPIDTIRRRLQVGTIIAGSVSSSGSMLRVSVRLVDAATGTQLKSLSMRQPLLNLFAVQDTMMMDVALWLRERIGEQVRLRYRAAGSAEAWELVQRGEEMLRTSARQPLPGAAALALYDTADSLLLAAQRLAPEWERPRTSRLRTALARAFAYTSGAGSGDAFRAGLYRVIALADSTLRSHPDAVQARATRGEALLRLATLAGLGSGDSLLRSAEKDLEAAITARQDLARVWYALGEARRLLGRHGDAVDAYQTAYDHDPYLAEAPAILSSMFFSMLFSERFMEARETCTIARRHFATDQRFTDCPLHVVAWTGASRSEVDSAWNLVTTLEQTSPQAMADQVWAWRRTLVAVVAARAGLQDSARAIIHQVAAERKARPPADVPLAYVHLLLGEHKDALAVLERHLRAVPASAAMLATHPWFRPLGADNRFRELLRR